MPIRPSRAAGPASAFARVDSPSVRAVRRSSRTPRTTRITTPAMIASAIAGAWRFTLSIGAGLEDAGRLEIPRLHDRDTVRIDVTPERGVDVVRGQRLDLRFHG